MGDSNPFVGSWTYRSLLNNPDLTVEFNGLEFGRANLVVADGPSEILGGTIGGDGWSLALHGSRSYGSPMQARFQGRGTVGGQEWVYDYLAWLVPTWPNSRGELQNGAMVGSVVRTLQHGTAPAGVVGSFYAVRQP